MICQLPGIKLEEDRDISLQDQTSLCSELNEELNTDKNKKLAGTSSCYQKRTSSSFIFPARSLNRHYVTFSKHNTMEH